MTNNSVVRIDARGVYYRELNQQLRKLTAEGARRIELQNVCGQRYIGTDLEGAVEIEIFGTPGNDLGAFMDGPRITVRGNAQDGCGNTMNEGEIIIHGHAGDITSLSAAAAAFSCAMTSATASTWREGCWCCWG
jgi:glutamate synthase domain-containing protein 3